MRPNVVLVTVDSLRADHVSCIGNAPVETPGIDSVAADGTAFTDAFAQGPFTTFSMPSLFTARYPSALHYVEFSENVVGVYATQETTVTEALSTSGYRTAGFHSNPLLSSLFHFERGFDVFDADLPFADLSLPGRLKLLTNKLRRLLRTHAYIPAEAVVNRALEWLNGVDATQPFFLWTHFMDVHGPYQRKTGFTYYNKFRSERLWQKAVRFPEEISDAEHEEIEETYREEVTYTDQEIGRLVDRVDSAGQRPTLVIVTADHGDGFREHGYYGHPHETHNVLINVPLVLRDPTDTMSEGVVDYPVELIDVAPTLLDIADVSIPETFEGTSWATSVSEANARQQPPIAISEAELTPGYRAAFISDHWKYVSGEHVGEEHLYERTAAGFEGREVTESEPETLQLFRDRLTDHLGRDGAVTASLEEAAHAIEDEDIRDRLEKLGYLE